MNELTSIGIQDQQLLRQSDSLGAVQQKDRTLEVAQKFEALLLFTMMKSMRASLSEDTLIGSDQQDMYREMMDQEIAQSIAASGGLGIQQMLERQLNSTSSGVSAEIDQSMIQKITDTPVASTDLSARQAIIAKHRILQQAAN